MNSKKSYDSEFCGSLPLNHINVIQAYGYLVVLERESLKIIQVSENTADLFNKKVTEIINTSFAGYLRENEAEKLTERFSTELKDKIPLTVHVGEKRMLALGHLKEAYLILELEHAENETDRPFTSVFEEIKYAMAAIELAGSVDEVSKIAVHELKKLSGFDGVMMYRFDSEWNGTVIAEEKEQGLENYMGHTFPASDVPKQARDLYLKNSYRLIPDRNYTPIRLYPVINPGTHTFTDLSDCNIRGVAAVHLEYLKNMNVCASMSIRVIRNGQLWGLIACHHITQRYLNFEVCSVLELLSSVVSNKISAILYKENFEFETDIQKKQTCIQAQIYAADDLISGLVKEDGENLMDLFTSTGTAIIKSGKTSIYGEVPDADFLDNLMLWLQSKGIDSVYASDQFPFVYDDALPYAECASGILVIPINADNSDYIINFRPEVIQTINWGGNPNNAINFEADGKNYHPRNSFKLWQQTVRNTSVAWKKEELEAAEDLRSFIHDFITKN